MEGGDVDLDSEASIRHDGGHDLSIKSIRIRPFPCPHIIDDRDCSKFLTLVYRIQGSSIRWAPGLVHFVPAVAYHFCLNLPAVFSQPGNSLIEIPCMYRVEKNGMRNIAKQDPGRVRQNR